MSAPLSNLEPFPIACFPSLIAADLVALAGRVGVPVEAAAWGALTVLAGAVGNSVKIRTPSKVVPLCLQTVILPPVHAEGRWLLDLLVEPLQKQYAALVEWGRLNSVPTTGSFKPAAPELGVEVSADDGSKRLLAEHERRKVAASAPEVVAAGMQSHWITEKVLKSFDRAVLIVESGDDASDDTVDDMRELLLWLEHSYWGQLHATERPNHPTTLNLLSMAPVARSQHMVQQRLTPRTWTIIDARQTKFSFPSAPSAGLLAGFTRAVESLFTRRIRSAPRVLEVGAEVLRVINEIGTEAAALVDRDRGASAHWLSRVVTQVFRVSGLLALIDDPDANRISLDHAEKAASAMRWWMSNQRRIGGMLTGSPEKRGSRCRAPDIEADKRKLREVLKQTGPIVQRDLVRKLPTRSKGYWFERISELVSSRQVATHRDGRSTVVQLVESLSVNVGASLAAGDDAGAGAWKSAGKAADN